MLVHDKKAAVTVMMKKRGPKGGEVLSGPAPMKAAEAMDEDRMPNGKLEAAKDVLAAHHEKDPMKLMQALSNFHDIHKSEAEALSPDTES